MIELIKTYLTGKGFTNIFLHHGVKSDADHITLTSPTQRAKTKDGLEKYFNDILVVKIIRYDTIETLLTDKNSLIGDLIGLHLTTEIIKSVLNNQSEPIKFNSQSWIWIGIFQVIGEYS